MRSVLVAALVLVAAPAEGVAFVSQLPVTSPLARARAGCPSACQAGAFAARSGRSTLFGRLAEVAPLRRARASGLSSLKAMFTGIVEEMGSVSALKEEEMTAWDAPGKTVKGVTLTLAAETVLEGAYEGCSIAVSAPLTQRFVTRWFGVLHCFMSGLPFSCMRAQPTGLFSLLTGLVLSPAFQVNGVCLTVTNFDEKGFTVGVSASCSFLAFLSYPIACALENGEQPEHSSQLVMNALLHFDPTDAHTSACR